MRSRILKSKVLLLERGKDIVPCTVTLNYGFHTYTVCVDGKVYKSTPNELFAVQTYNAI